MQCGVWCMGGAPQAAHMGRSSTGLGHRASQGMQDHCLKESCAPSVHGSFQGPACAWETKAHANALVCRVRYSCSASVGARARRAAGPLLQPGSLGSTYSKR